MSSRPVFGHLLPCRNGIIEGPFAIRLQRARGWTSPVRSEPHQLQPPQLKKSARCASSNEGGSRPRTASLVHVFATGGTAGRCADGCSAVAVSASEFDSTAPAAECFRVAVSIVTRQSGSSPFVKDCAIIALRSSLKGERYASQPSACDISVERTVQSR